MTEVIKTDVHCPHCSKLLTEKTLKEKRCEFCKKSLLVKVGYKFEK